MLPSNATRKGTVAACEASLRRLRTDWLDLYLLHWPGSHPLEETIAGLRGPRRGRQDPGMGREQLPKASKVTHVEDNARAASLRLDTDELHRIDAAFPLKARGSLPVI